MSYSPLWKTPFWGLHFLDNNWYFWGEKKLMFLTQIESCKSWRSHLKNIKWKDDQV